MKAITIFSAFVLMASVSSAEKLPLKVGSAGSATIKSFNQVFNFMHVHRQGRGVTVAWNTSMTSSVVSEFTVMRTYEDPNDPYSVWEVVNVLTCTSGRSYRCTDQNVSPGSISYMVIASMVGGGTVVSQINTVRIVRH
jgi:hypothetical protein